MVKKPDIEAVLDIWLEASIKAHNFVPATYWESKLDAMREVYLPASESFVYEKDNVIMGFIAVHHKTLAALFVSPSRQGGGIGSSLIAFVKAKYQALELSVYKANKASIAFYEKHGFTMVGERLDEHTGHPELVMRLSP